MNRNALCHLLSFADEQDLMQFPVTDVLKVWLVARRVATETSQCKGNCNKYESTEICGDGHLQ